MDPFDRARCSFPIPDFTDGEEEQAWAMSLRPEQRLELLYLMQLWRWGEKRMNARIDRTAVQMLTMEQFVRLKEEEDAAEERWRAEHGYPPRFGSTPHRRPTTNE